VKKIREQKEPAEKKKFKDVDDIEELDPVYTFIRTAQKFNMTVV
jgi:hypothetical protein